jgi:hypothetical protein
MKNTTGNVLRADLVKLEGQLQLDLLTTQPDIPKAQSATSAAPKARILENQPEFAIIEITCPCGAKTNLRCQYAPPDTSAQPDKTQNQTHGNTSQASEQTK